MPVPTPRHIAIANEFDQPYPHHVFIFEGIERYAHNQPGWTYTVDEHPGYRLTKRSKTRQHYDGVIGRLAHAAQNRLKKLGIPFVNLHQHQHRPGVPGVFSDLAAVGRMAVDHLSDRGFKQLAVLTDPEFVRPNELRDGFVQRCEELEIDCLEFDLEGIHFTHPDNWLKLEKRMAQFMEMIQPPIGAFLSGVGNTRLLVQTAREYGLRIPQDLAVISQTNVAPLFLIRPQITSIEHNYIKVGQVAAELLHRLMDGEPAPEKPIRVPPGRVIARESTDYFAVTDEVVVEALRYISPRLAEKLRVEDIAYAINVSPRLLQTRFADTLGVGVSEEVRRLRFEKAKLMLAEPDWLVSDIPKKVGFATLDVMNKVFKREIGMTPGQFRKGLMAK